MLKHAGVATKMQLLIPPPVLHQGVFGVPGCNWSGVSRTHIHNIHTPLFHRMTTVQGAGIHGMHIVYAFTYGEFFDDADAHVSDSCCVGEVERPSSMSYSALRDGGFGS